MSLKYRIALTIFVLEALMMGFVLSQTISRFDEATRRHLADAEAVVLQLLTGVGRATLLTEEYSEMQPYLDQVGEDSRVLSAMLADHRGIVVASLDGADIGAPLPPATVSADRFLRRVPISNAAGLSGTVAVEFSNVPLQEASAQIRRGAIATAVAGMGLIAVVGVLTGVFLTRKLDRVASAARRLASGDLEARSGVEGADEIGRLGQTFDGMASALEAERQALQASESRLRQAQKMEAIGLLAGGVAHDFNNILTVINGYSELMLSLEDLPQRERVEEIAKAAERASSLTQQLLAFSRGQVLEPRVMDLNAAVTETSKLLSRVIGEDIEIVAELDPSLGNVKADPGQIQQVLMNLALNARDAMPHGGKLTLETTNVEIGEADARVREGLAAGAYVSLVVSDDGIGMTEDVVSHVFEPFFTTKGETGGTGLGLSTVYGIVRQSDGYIDVKSEPRAGSAFEIVLPRVDGRVSASVNTSASPGEGAGTILLVEDDAAVRGLAHTILTEHGYQVLEAADGESALRLLGEHGGRVLLVITDLVMPVMGGLELAEAVGAKYPMVKILFTTGYFGGAQRGSLGKGANLLRKPFSASALLEKVGSVLDTAST